jgi:hypothetical protein
MVDAYRLAADDSYRAATHNKGIMNGISAVVLATGNDTRAVEAGCHSHAVGDGRYTTMSHLEKDSNGQLVATVEVPMPVGLVGGATKTQGARLIATPATANPRGLRICGQCVRALAAVLSEPAGTMAPDHQGRAAAHALRDVEIKRVALAARRLGGSSRETTTREDRDKATSS